MLSSFNGLHCLFQVETIKNRPIDIAKISMKVSVSCRQIGIFTEACARAFLFQLVDYNRYTSGFSASLKLYTKKTSLTGDYAQYVPAKRGIIQETVSIGVQRRLQLFPLMNISTKPQPQFTGVI